MQQYLCSRKHNPLIFVLSGALINSICALGSTTQEYVFAPGSALHRYYAPGCTNIARCHEGDWEHENRVWTKVKTNEGNKTCRRSRDLVLEVTGRIKPRKDTKSNHQFQNTTN